MSGDPRQTFLQEAHDLLDQLESTLLDLEHTPGNSDLIDTAFRALHTIKGSGAMFGFDAVAGFTHHVETAFDLVRQGQMAPDARLFALTLTARDHMRALIEHPDTADRAPGEAIIAELAALMAEAGQAPAPPAEPAELENPDAGAWRIRFRLPAAAMATGTNPLLLLDELRELGTTRVRALAEDVPPLEAIDPTACYLRWEVSLHGRASHAAIEQVFLFVLDDMDLDIEPLARKTAAPDGPAALAPPAPAPTPPAAVPTAVPNAVALANRAAPAPPPSRAEAESDAAATRRAARAADTVRVPAERLDEMMDRVGELVIAQSRLKQIAEASTDPAVKSVAEEIERLSLELRDTTMGIRMVPIIQLFGRFRRLVHDLGRELGKEIELVMVGEETELDKTLIERLNDPLVHLIRNAVDHGLEDAASRIAAGKPAQGQITLTARHAGAEVLVSITDDGRGLDRDRIRARAEANGLIAPGARPADHELFQVIFQPGFSTAAQVTSLSGRGVGMDVVKRTIDGLRGSIDIASNDGRGSVITLRLPLTLAIIDGLLVRVGRGRYVIPLSAVEECVELSQEDDARSRGRSFLNIRGDLVPFLRLRELFNVSLPPDRYQKVVIVSAGDLRVGLVVDQVIGDHQTVIKSMSKLHADVEIFSGATILGDGSVALILDITHLVEHGQAREERLMAAG
jgi:two-component system chemotaxis sensor kinase CheA